MEIFASWSQYVGASNQPTEFWNFFHKSRYGPKRGFTGGKCTFWPIMGLVKKFSKFCRLVRCPHILWPRCKNPHVKISKNLGLVGILVSAIWAKWDFEIWPLLWVFRGFYGIKMAKLSPIYILIGLPTILRVNDVQNKFEVDIWKNVAKIWGF